MPPTAAAPASAPEPLHLSPGRRAWQRFRRNKLGFYSLVLFCTLVVLRDCILNSPGFVSFFVCAWAMKIGLVREAGNVIVPIQVVPSNVKAVGDRLVP